MNKVKYAMKALDYIEELHSKGRLSQVDYEAIMALDYRRSMGVSHTDEITLYITGPSIRDKSMRVKLLGGLAVLTTLDLDGRLSVATFSEHWPQIHDYILLHQQHESGDDSVTVTIRSGGKVTFGGLPPYTRPALEAYLDHLGIGRVSDPIPGL